jgi:two-component sensor histidine kinase
VSIIAKSLPWWSSVKGRLIALIAATVVPMVGFSALLATRYAESERRAIETRRLDVAKNLTVLIDGEVSAIEAVLAGLAKTPDLLRGDIGGFRAYAETLIGERIAVLALLEPSGQQIMSTFVPLGQPLPKRDDMKLFEPVFRGENIVSGIVQGTAVQRPIISIAAPVIQNGRATYTLSAVVYPERFTQLFARADVNPKWAAAVVDRDGRFVARNLNPDRFIGKQARPELGAVARGEPDVGTFDNTTLEGVHTGNSFRRSQLTGWTSVVAVPREVLEEPLTTALKWLALGAAFVTLVSVGFASLLAARIARSIGAFKDAASALIEGKSLPATPSYIQELIEVRTAFEHTEAAVLARRQADQNVRFLLRELSHRSKNLIAVIQAVANRTARTATSLEDFRGSFSKRLQGLAVSHDLLVKEEWQGARLGELVHDHLLPFVDPSSPRVNVACGTVLLSATAAQAVGLALHELATNASKYGALSGMSGKVTISCAVAEDEPAHPLKVRWIESGGPPVQPPARSGFGQIVIDSMVSTAVGGRAELDYDPQGFKWTLTISPEHFILTEALPAGSTPLLKREDTSSIALLAGSL